MDYEEMLAQYKEDREMVMLLLGGISSDLDTLMGRKREIEHLKRH